MKKSGVLLLAILNLCLFSSLNIGCQAQSRTAKLISSKGYLAEDHYIEVQNGEYTLNLVRVKNPLINSGQGGLPGKDPLLFIHGAFLNANIFFINNDGVEPRKYVTRNISSTSTKELQRLLKSDPGSKSLVFTTLNFGYDVWLLNRRTTRDSRLATQSRHERNISRDFEEEDSQRLFNIFEPIKAFNYSFDEQATYDVPETIDYVLNKTNSKKLSLINYSASCTIVLMSLTDKPQLASKLSNVIMWAPIMDFGYGYTPVFDQIFEAALPIVSRTPVPFPPEILVPVIEIITGVTCRIPILRPLVCDLILDILFGLGSSQLEAQNLSPENYYLDTTAVMELAQYYQSFKKFRMHRFDFIERSRNLAAYNQSDPPIYDTSMITSNKISFWVGKQDRLANLRNYELSKERLTIPIQEHIIGNSEILFNHLAFALHKNITELLIIPTLKTIALG